MKYLVILSVLWFSALYAPQLSTAKDTKVAPCNHPACIPSDINLAVPADAVTEVAPCNHPACVPILLDESKVKAKTNS